MPDPGEPMGSGMLERAARAGLVPGWPAGSDLVHLVVRLGHDVTRWATLCPADVEGLRAGVDDPRAVIPVLELVSCAACREADGDLVAGVDAMTKVYLRRRMRVAGDVLSFLRFAREELGLVLADYAGGVQLKAYPSSSDQEFVQRWLAQRPLTD